MSNNKKIQFKIATPERIIFQEEAEQLTIPTQKGEITILPNHIPLISNLAPGIIDIKAEGELLEVAISGGFMEIHSNELIILADTAERAEEIDIERAEKAKQMAESRKQQIQRGFDESQYATVISQIEKQFARLKLGKRYQKRARSRIDISNNN